MTLLKKGEAGGRREEGRKRGEREEREREVDMNHKIRHLFVVREYFQRL